MEYVRNLLCSLLLTAAVVGPVAGHHSVFAEFDIMRSGTIEGVVTEIWYKSPHVRMFVDVTGEVGQVVAWNTHAHTPGALRRNGWLPETIKVGDKVIVTGDPTRDGSPKLFIRTVTMEDGTVLENKAGGG
jgi:hypothetical protein